MVAMPMSLTRRPCPHVGSRHVGSRGHPSPPSAGAVAHAISAVAATCAGLRQLGSHHPPPVMPGPMRRPAASVCDSATRSVRRWRALLDRLYVPGPGAHAQPFALLQVAPTGRHGGSTTACCNSRPGEALRGIGCLVGADGAIAAGWWRRGRGLRGAGTRTHSPAGPLLCTPGPLPNQTSTPEGSPEQTPRTQYGVDHGTSRHPRVRTHLPPERSVRVDRRCAIVGFSEVVEVLPGPLPSGGRRRPRRCQGRRPSAARRRQPSSPQMGRGRPPISVRSAPVPRRRRYRGGAIDLAHRIVRAVCNRPTADNCFR